MYMCVNFWGHVRARGVQGNPLTQDLPLVVCSFVYWLVCLLAFMIAQSLVCLLACLLAGLFGGLFVWLFGCLLACLLAGWLFVCLFFCLFAFACVWSPFHQQVWHCPAVLRGFASCVTRPGLWAPSRSCLRSRTWMPGPSVRESVSR